MTKAGKKIMWKHGGNLAFGMLGYAFALGSAWMCRVIAYRDEKEGPVFILAFAVLAFCLVYKTAIYVHACHLEWIRDRAKLEETQG